MRKSSAVLAFLLLTISCSKVKELDDRTKNMEEATQKMSKTTNNMDDTTGVMYQQLRSGDTASLRLKAYEHMENPDVGIGNKIADACIYFKAMEYQLWTDNDLFDNEDLRNSMYLDAANEFTKRLSDTYDQINLKRMSPTDKVDGHNQEMMFYSFAVALHMNHHFQDEIVKRDSKLQTFSMYDMAKKALVKNVTGHALEEHEEILVNGSNRQMMIDLLKARVDMLAALGLKNLTDKKSMSIKQKLKGALFLGSGGHLGSVDLPEVYNKDDKTTNKWTKEYLDGALKTKIFLTSIGEKVKLEKTLKSAFKELDFNQKESTVETQDDGQQRQQQKPDRQQEELKELIFGLLE